MASNNASGVFKADLGRLMTPLFSSELVAYLRSRRWTDQRIARTIGAPVDFVNRVHVGMHCFTGADLKKLAKAQRVDPMQLLFDAMEPAVSKSDLGGLWRSTKKSLQAGESFVATLRRRPGRKSKLPARAA